MVAEMNYNSFDKELVFLRNKCKTLLKEINDYSNYFDYNPQRERLSKLFGSIRNNDAYVEPPFRCEYGFNIHVGKKFYCNFDCTILDEAEVRIGDDVLFGPKVQIHTACHPTDCLARVTDVEFAKKINIGNNVWLGAGVIVLAGVTIGDNTVIGAGSVVTKNIPSDVVAVGNPCKVIKSIDNSDYYEYKNKQK